MILHIKSWISSHCEKSICVSLLITHCEVRSAVQWPRHHFDLYNNLGRIQDRLYTEKPSRVFVFVFVLFALEHYYNMVAWVFSIGCLRQLMTLQFCDVLHFENIFSYLIKIHFSKFKSERDTTTTDMESYPIKFQRNQSKVNSYVFQILLNFFKSSHRY